MWATQNFTIKTGKTWSAGINIEASPGVPMDLTGCTLRGQMRKTPGGDLIAEIDCEITDAAMGAVFMEITDEVAASIPGPSSFAGSETYYYDVDLLKVDGSVECILSGSFVVYAGVTQSE